jgi:hypothetical protein
MKIARMSPVARIAAAISQSVRRFSEKIARSSASPVRNAATTAAACEPIASATETASDHL